MAEIAVAGATRPFPGERVNGDLWTVHIRDGYCRISIVDGLGHGPEAAAAAAAAREVLEARTTLSPEDTIRACHQALKGSRGAVMLVASIDSTSKSIHYAGIGNVEGRLIQEGREERLVSYRGIVGLSLPKIRPFAIDLARDWMLLLHTDGVSSRFDLEDLQGYRDQGPDAIAGAILRGWGRITDDATVIVAAPQSGPTPSQS